MTTRETRQREQVREALTTIKLPAPAPFQLERLRDPARFRIWLSGRRSRKTTTAFLGALLGLGPIDPATGIPLYPGAIHGANIWVVGLNAPQAGSFWRLVSGTLGPIAEDVSVIERRVVLPGGGAIQVRSAAHPDALVGDVRGLNGVVLDEASKFHPDVWAKAIRPALADTHGFAFFTTTPDAANTWFRDLFEAAKNNPEWKVWQTASTINPYFDEREIERSRADGMSEALLRQEYGGEWVTFAAARTFDFDAAVHLRECGYRYGMPLVCSLSFACAPPAWIVSQSDLSRGEPEYVFDEIASTQDQSLRGLIAEFKRRYPQHANGQNVRFYVGVRERDGAGYSDHSIIRSAFPKAGLWNTGDTRPDKDTINATNLLLRGPNGEVRASIDPRCVRLRRDLENVVNEPETFRVDPSSGNGAYAAAWADSVYRRYPLFQNGPLLNPPVVSTLDAMDRHVLDKLRKAGS